MTGERKPIVILLADDDEVDRLLACEALAESRLSNEVHCTRDGEELMDYLKRRGRYAPPITSHRASRPAPPAPSAVTKP